MPRSERATLSRKPILFRFPHSALSVLMKLYSSAGNYPSDICPAFWVQDRGREIVNLIFSCCLLFRKERVVMDEKLTGLLQPKEKKKLLQDHCKIINILIKKKKNWFILSGFVQVHTSVLWVQISKREIAWSFLVSSELQVVWRASVGQLSGLFLSANEWAMYFISLLCLLVVSILSSQGVVKVS